MNYTLAYTALVASTYFAHFSIGQMQSNNVFLDRNFWKKETTITEVKEMIEKGNDLAASNRANFDAFYFGIMAGTSIEVLKFIVDYPGNGVNKPSHDGRTNLFWAASTGNAEMVEYFLSKGASTDLIDEKGMTVLLFAASNGCTNTKVYDLLIAKGANPKKEKSRSGANVILLAAPHANNLELLTYFDKKGATFKSVDTEGNGLIEYALQTGNTEIVKQLQQEVKINPTTKNAVLFAAQGQRNKINGVEVFQFIENQLKLPLTTTNNNKQNVFHILAGKCADLETLSYLKGKVDFKARDEKGNLPIHYAAKSLKNQEIVKNWIGWYEEEIDVKNDMGASPILYAIEGNTASIIAILSQYSDINTKDKNGNNYVTYLIEGIGRGLNQDLKEKVDYLAKSGMEFDSKQANGNTIYHLLAQKGNIELLKFFIPFINMDKDIKNDLGLTPLHIVAMNAKSVQDIKNWISLGFDPKVVSDLDETTFQLATENEVLQAKAADLEFLK